MRLFLCMYKHWPVSAEARGNQLESRHENQFPGFPSDIKRPRSFEATGGLRGTWGRVLVGVCSDRVRKRLWIDRRCWRMSFSWHVLNADKCFRTLRTGQLKESVAYFSHTLFQKYTERQWLQHIQVWQTIERGEWAWLHWVGFPNLLTLLVSSAANITAWEPWCLPPIICLVQKSKNISFWFLFRGKGPDTWVESCISKRRENSAWNILFSRYVLVSMERQWGI